MTYANSDDNGTHYLERIKIMMAKSRFIRRCLCTARCTHIDLIWIMVEPNFHTPFDIFGARFSLIVAMWKDGHQLE